MGSSAKKAKPLLQPFAVLGASYGGTLVIASFLGFCELLLLSGIVCVLCVGAALLTVCGKLRTRAAAAVLLSAAAALFVASAQRGQLISTAETHAGREASFSGTVEEAWKGFTSSYLIRAEEGLPTGTRVLVYVNGAPEYAFGERISLSASINPDPPSRSQFGKGATLTANASAEDMKLKEEAGTWESASSSLREWVRGQLYRTMDRGAAAFYSAVFLGDSGELTAAQREAFSATGTIHLLCISGLHISLLAAIAGWCFRRIFQNFGLSFAATLLFAGVFVLFTGAGASSVRAYIMAAFALSAKAFCRDYSPGNALGAAVLLLTVMRPHVVFQSGFWLSVLATYAVFGLAPGWTQTLSQRLFGVGTGFLVRMGKGILSGLCTTLSANLCCLPVFFLWFGSVPLIAPAANLFMVPLLPILMGAGAVCVALGGAAAPLGHLLSLLFKKLLQVLAFLEEWNAGYLPLRVGWLLFLFLAGGLFFLTLRGLHARRGFQKLAGALLLLLFAVGVWSEALPLQNVLAVRLVETPSGGSIVLENGGNAVLIGCGGDARIGGKTANALRAGGIRTVDAVLVPKETRRLMSGVEGLADRIKVGTVFCDNQSNWSRIAEESPRVGTVRVLTPGESLLFGKFPVTLARVEKYTRFSVLAGGRVLLFLSGNDPGWEKLSPCADAIIFYDEIPQRDGNPAGECVIIGKKPNPDSEFSLWLGGFLEYGENFAEQTLFYFFPDGRVKARKS